MIKFNQTINPQPGEPDYSFHCPGCGCDHGIWTKENGDYKSPLWNFNGDLESPSVTPSIRVRYKKTDSDFICHSWITDGQIKFFDDSSHDLRGQTVPLENY